MSSTPEFTTEQLAAARATRWHQGGDALLTQEAARDWLNELGLVLFSPRAQQLPTPAPSFVEATLGRTAEAPTIAESETARGLVARMVAEGSALPLNLLGGPGDLPDFIVSAQVFSYVFTLRGDKAWKQAPSTSGAVKVSPLALKVYEVLSERGALTAAELVSELGRELTENAIARALGELWVQLRVIPLLQQDGAATLWELTSRRFTKVIKAGANAGQPTALSALISLYLAQAYAATDEEIETFLSPLAARSRVREVVHGLTAGRQLENAVLQGKTLLYIPGALPEFPQMEKEELAGEGAEIEASAEPAKKVGTGRISSFAGRKASDLRGKPARSFAAGRSREAGGRPAGRFGGARAEGRSDRERRPFKRDGAPGKPSFTKPWNEDRKPRGERAEGASAEAGAAESFRKFRKPEGEDRKPLGDREQAGLPAEKRVFSKPKFERESRARDEAKRPYKPRSTEGGERSFTKRPYTPRTSEGGERGFARPRFDRGGKPGGFGAKRPYKPRDAEGGERSFTKRPYTPRTSEGGERGAAKPRFGGEGKPGGFGAKRPYKARGAEGGERPFAKRPYTPRGTGEGERPKRPYTPRREGSFDRSGATPARKGFGAKPAGKVGGKPAGKFGGKPGGKFAGKPGGKFGAKKFGAKPGGFGGKRGGAGGTRPTPRQPEAEE